MPNIPGRPDLDNFVVNHARAKGIPIIIAAIGDLISIADGNPMILGTVDGSTEVCVKLAGVDELREAITRAQAGMAHPPGLPTEERLRELTKPLSQAMREYNPAEPWF